MSLQMEIHSMKAITYCIFHVHLSLSVLPGATAVMYDLKVESQLWYYIKTRHVTF